AIVAPSGAIAKARMGESPIPRTRLAGIASLGGPEIGNQGRTASPRRSRPIHLRLHTGAREVPIREVLGPSSLDLQIKSKSVVWLRDGDSLGGPGGPGGRGIGAAMGWAS